MVRFFNWILLFGLFHGGTSFEKKNVDFDVGVAADSKRDGSPTPNDLFWANRGKKSSPSSASASQYPKSFWARPQSLLLPMTFVQTGPQQAEMADHRAKRANLANLSSLRPNSFMNMYLAKGSNSGRKRANGMGQLNRLRPNSFLFPSVMQQAAGTGKRSLWNKARPNSYLFPSIKASSIKRLAAAAADDAGPLKSLRPNSFIFPIPKRDQTFFAGRGKKSFPSHENVEEEAMTLEELLQADMQMRAEQKRSDSDLDTGVNFFAGRGKKSEEDYADNDDGGNAFFAGRGKKSSGGGDDDDGDYASFLAGRGKKDTRGDSDMTFFAGRGKREAKGGKGGSGSGGDEVFWAVRG